MAGKRPEAELFLEYPAELRPVLGARYGTVCGVTGPMSDRYEHSFLLWSDEPFTDTIVSREMTALGFEVLTVSSTPNDRRPWTVTISGGPPDDDHTHLGLFHGAKFTTINWVGVWARRTGRVIHDKPDEGWRAVHANLVLYDERDLYDLPSDQVVILTERQATGLAVTAGRRLPTGDEIAAAVHTAEQAHSTRMQLWQRFYDRRAEQFAHEVHRLRAEAALLADAAPPRQPVYYDRDRDEVVARTPALQIGVDETFPLLRFLVGDFRDRSTSAHGSYTTPGSYTLYANRLDVLTSTGEVVALTLQVMVRGGLLVHGQAFTPFCPAEADYTADPDVALELDLARSGDRLPQPLSSSVYPASPARVQIWGNPVPKIRGDDAPFALRRLGIALTFPTHPELAAVPAWSDTFHQWERFVTAARITGPPLTRHHGRELFVPDDINIMKTVQARIVEWPFIR